MGKYPDNDFMKGKTRKAKNGRESAVMIVMEVQRSQKN